MVQWAVATSCPGSLYLWSTQLLCNNFYTSVYNVPCLPINFNCKQRQMNVTRIQWIHDAVPNYSMCCIHIGDIQPARARPLFDLHGRLTRSNNKAHLNTSHATVATTVLLWLYISDTNHPIILQNISTPVLVQMSKWHHFKCKLRSVWIFTRK